MSKADRIMEALRDLALHGAATHGAYDRRYLALHRQLREAKRLPKKYTWLSPRVTR